MLSKSEINCPEDTIPIVWVEPITLSELGHSFKAGHHIPRGFANVRGQKHGLWMAWYERAEIVQQGTFNHGRREGKVMNHYEHMCPLKAFQAAGSANIRSRDPEVT